MGNGQFGASARDEVPAWVYDITGKLIRTPIANQPARPGYYNQTWNCTDSRDRRIPAAIRFYRLFVRGHDSKSERWRLCRRCASGSCPQTRTRKLVVTR